MGNTSLSYKDTKNQFNYIIFYKRNQGVICVIIKLVFAELIITYPIQGYRLLLVLLPPCQELQGCQKTRTADESNKQETFLFYFRLLFLMVSTGK